MQLAVRLDALATLRDSERLEKEARPLLESRTYTEPCALRPLGIVRGDEQLLAEADERFVPRSGSTGTAGRPKCS